MPENPPAEKRSLPKPGLRRLLLGLAACLLLVIWLGSTPPGLLGKTDAVGYAVCHRIASHSFYLGERPFSFCARCSGQYLGFLWGYLIQLVLAKKRSGFPGRWTMAGMAALVLFYLADGLNSAIQLYPDLSSWSIYQPSNSLRLFSGLGMGLVISLVLYPLVGQTIWKDHSPEPAFSGFQTIVLVLGGALAVGGLVHSANPLVLYPLILLSAAGLLVLLTLLYGVIWILITRRENSFGSWQELLWYGLGGFSSALLQILLIDGIRYLLTGTWSGFLEY